ncbi:MAG TPA: tRNA preQ1(34) S-adenosylmethionine ribosyltransferase-isomerase QueA [Candidatus Paceibacterota bacterium]
MIVDDYKYKLPNELIANKPAEPRDAARLMIYSTATDEIVFDTFANISRYLPGGSLLVLNDTKVVPARMPLTKVTGGTVNILFLMNEWNGGTTIKGLPDRMIVPGEALYLVNRPVAEVVSNVREEFTFNLKVTPDQFRQLCEVYGRTPLPPYIHSDLPEERVRVEYQTTYAARPASVAAPTASLHFTDRVFAALEAKEIQRTYVTLHVGRGTFSPVTADMEKTGKLHAEPIHISGESAELIRATKAAGKPVIASGTTAIRLLESAPDQILAGQSYDGETALFIRPPYQFRVADALITNFHLPGTSLLSLLDAFLQSKQSRKSWRDLYDVAVRDHFRFYSFGDAMLIL